MLLVVLTLLPIALGFAAWALREPRQQLVVLVLGAALHLALVVALWVVGSPEPVGELFALDELGHVLLTVTSVLFLLVASYCVPYLLEGTHDEQVSPQRFVPLLFWLLASMTLVMTTQHLGVLWAAVEATTLASAPLVYFYRRKSALEAAWKYLLLCSIGIALALLATFFLGIAASAAPGGGQSLTLAELAKDAAHMPPRWVRAAFLLALVGYGTKMGLAPLHAWLPDAHSQAPSPVSALLSGCVLNCALLAILRFYMVCVAAGQAAFARELFLLLGMASLLVAAALMVGQRDYKRLFAYSSVENMGVIAVGIGVGGAATSGALLHLALHSFAKAGLFLLAGNLLREFRTTEANGVTGAFSRLPHSGPLLAALVFAIGGSPPFGVFVSELAILRAAVSSGRPLLAAAFVVLVAIAFVAMAGVVLPMLQGKPDTPPARGEAAWSVAPAALLALAVLVPGIWLPDALSNVLSRLALALGGSAL
jgi:hydrogenase-4 component F